MGTYITADRREKGCFRPGEEMEARGRAGLMLSEDQIEAFLEDLEASGCAETTVPTYRRKLKQFYAWLPEDKYIRRKTLAKWVDSMLDSGNSAATVNVAISAINSLLQFLDRKELRIEHCPVGNSVQPELTRAEYLRLLSAARMLDKERAYLMVKVFGTTGITVSDLEKVTAEAVQTGKINLPSGSVHISDGLRKELVHFMQAEGITSGPVFLTKAGKPQDRTSVTNLIGSLCTDARVPEEKGNPRCLRKLYITTQDTIRENLAVLAEQSYNRLLEKEQDAVGWEQNF